MDELWIENLDVGLAVAYGAIILIATLTILYGVLTQEENEEVQVVGTAEAVRFPIVASVMLLSLFFLLKYLPKYWVNLLFNIFLGITGLSSLGRFFEPFVVRLRFVLGSRLTSTRVLFRLRWKNWIDEEVSPAYAISFCLGALVIVWYGLTKNWIANNIFGIAFCVLAVQVFTLSSFKASAILLILLFFYDIFWVFGTPVMVSVAKNFDAPIKIVFPKDLLRALVATEYMDFTMLGLGDIVFPGIFIAQMYRFDENNALSSSSGSSSISAVHEHSVNKDSSSKRVPHPYFIVSLVSYAIGLLITICIMHIFHSAQPALLYLVPACLGSTFIFALTHSEIRRLIFYEEPTPSEQESDGLLDKDSSDKILPVDAPEKYNSSDPTSASSRELRSRSSRPGLE